MSSASFAPERDVGAHDNVHRANRLLAALSPRDLAVLAPHLEPIALARGKVLFEPGDEVVTTYFPCHRTMASLLIVTRDGREVEAATIGREGAVGGIVSEGHKPAFGRAVVQIPGAAFAILRHSASGTSASRRRITGTGTYRLARWRRTNDMSDPPDSGRATTRTAGNDCPRQRLEQRHRSGSREPVLDDARGRRFPFPGTRYCSPTSRSSEFRGASSV